MLQMNETNLLKNAFKKSILLQDCTNQRAVAKKQIFDLRQEKSQPDFLTCLLFGPRSPFKVFELLARRNSCSSSRDLFFVLRAPCFVSCIPYMTGMTADRFSYVYSYVYIVLIVYLYELREYYSHINMFIQIYLYRYGLSTQIPSVYYLPFTGYYSSTAACSITIGFDFACVPV